jgi:hypothetical protein
VTQKEAQIIASIVATADRGSDDPEDITMETFPEVIAFKKENN